MPEEPDQIAAIEPEQVAEDCHRAIEHVRELMARLHSQVVLAERGGFEPPVEI